MAREQFGGVQVRIMSDDPDAVEQAVALLNTLLGGAVSFTGTARNREGEGQRAFGTLSIRALEFLVEERE